MSLFIKSAKPVSTDHEYGPCPICDHRTDDFDDTIEDLTTCCVCFEYTELEAICYDCGKVVCHDCRAKEDE